MKVKLCKANVCKCYCHKIGYMGEVYCNCCKLAGYEYIDCDSTIDEDVYVKCVIDRMRTYRKDFINRFNIEVSRHAKK